MHETDLPPDMYNIAEGESESEEITNRNNSSNNNTIAAAYNNSLSNLEYDYGAPDADHNNEALAQADSFEDQKQPATKSSTSSSSKKEGTETDLAPDHQGPLPDTDYSKGLIGGMLFSVEGEEGAQETPRDEEEDDDLKTISNALAEHDEAVEGPVVVEQDDDDDPLEEEDDGDIMSLTPV